MLKKLKHIAKEAGQVILKYYDIPAMGIKVKSDGSPVTKADLGSENLIVSRLNYYFSFPILTDI